MAVKAPIYLQAEFNVSRSNHQPFVDKMKEILPVIFDRYRWELIYAAYPIVGNINRFIQIWKIPDEASVLRVMIDGADAKSEGNEEEPKILETTGEMQEFVFTTLYRELQTIISETTHTLTTSLSHDPTYWGQQALTLLVDAAGEVFLLDHEKMRVALEKYDVGGALEAERKKRWKVWRASTLLGEQAARAPSQQEDTTRDGTLQALLNHGAMVATVGSGETRGLLFNLAGIKPRSVFQTKEDINRDKARHDSPHGENERVDFPAQVAKLLIATPWGSVYDLSQQALSKDLLQQISVPILPQELAATHRLLSPLIQAQVPIAAIPEERDDVIGDGCMCFVINLSSFDSTRLPAATAKIKTKCQWSI